MTSSRQLRRRPAFDGAPLERAGEATKNPDPRVEGARREARASDRAWHISLGVVFVLGLCLFAYAFALSPARPGVLGIGWNGWADQKSYLNEVRYMARGELPAKVFLFGPAWPATGVPWHWLGFHDPFVVTDAFCFSAALVLTAILGRRIRSAAFGLGVAAALAVATPLLALTVEPWDSTVTLMAVLILLIAGTSGHVPSLAAGAWVGAAIGMAFAARYIDGVLLLPVAAWILLRHWRRETRMIVRAIVAAVFAMGLFVVPVLVAQNAAFGDPFKTPYVNHPGPKGSGAEQGFGSWNIGRAPRSFVEVFVTGSSRGVRQPGDPLGVRFPWAALAPVGCVALARSPRPRAGHRGRLGHDPRDVLLVAFGTSVLFVAVYCSFHAVNGASLRFDLLHYFKAWFPLWALLAAEGAVVAIQSVPWQREVARS